MILNTDGVKPIYMQIAEWLEAEILNGHIAAEEKMYSQYQLAEMFNINPATAAKGINLLAEEGVLYKKRGLGMFVAAEARQHILNKRKNENLQNLMLELVREAERLGIGEAELLRMVNGVIRDRGGEQR